MTRIYQQKQFEIDELFHLDEKASHHVAHVLRLRIQDPLILFNGEGGEYHAVITAISKRKVEVHIKHFISREAESSLQLYLAQGIARGEKMDWIIQKAVELGVKKIIPLLTERCNVKLNAERAEKRWQHWHSIMIHACEQSGRNRIPELLPPTSLQNALFSLKTDYQFVLSPHVKQTLCEYEIKHTASILLIIGPEGGLSEEEVNNILQQGGFPLQLGPRILRTETAAITAIAALQAYFGDFKKNP